MTPPPPGNYGERFAAAVREYLFLNGLKSLGQINGKILAELAQSFYEKDTAAAKTRRKKEIEEEWLKGLEAEPAFAGIDIRRELGKCQFWCKTRGLIASRQRFENWLLKAEKPVGFTYDGASSRPKPIQTKPVFTVEIPPPGWAMLLRYTVTGVSEAETDRLCALDWQELPVDVREKIIAAA